MKRTAILKRLGLTATIVALCLAIMITCFTFVKPARVFADTPASGDGTLFKNINVPEKCKYGDKFGVPAGESGTTVEVKAPNGTKVTPDAENKVTANQVGNYTVTYTKDKASYSFNVYVTLDEDFFLRVNYNGAEIPSYIQKGNSFVIPDANVVYYNDDNILVGYPKDELDITVYDSFDKTYKVGDTFTASENGKTYLTYSVRVGKGEDALKYFNQTFTVNVQSTFSDTAAPTLSVAGVTSDISINRPVTLPTATATDSYDDNVKIDIEVIDPDGQKVRLTDVDKYGYAYQDAAKLAADAANTDKSSWNYPELVFDNDKAMTFYPVKTGDYIVRYTAYDDALPTPNKSAVREYHMTCKDFKAPDFYNIADWMIPETWGLSVNGTENGIVSFPVPEVVDNKDHSAPQSEGDDNLISLYFRITDSDNSRTVLQIENVFASADSDDSKFKGNSVYGAEGETYSFADGKLDFDFKKYHKLDSKGDSTDLAGTYTVYYRARDKAQNTSSKTYTIKLENDYKDEAAPSTAEVTVPSYVSVNEESLDIPNPSVADAEDSRPHVEYKIYSDKEGLEDKEGGKFITVKGGEKAEFDSDDNGAFIIVDKDTDPKKLYLGKNLYFTVKATDKAGNVKANYTGDDVTTCDAKVKVIDAGAGSGETYNYTDALTLTGDIKAGVSKNVGGFTIDTTNVDMRDYVGFEVVVADPDGDPLNVTLDVINTIDDRDNPTKATIYVKNITFIPATATGTDEVYTITVRVFDVNGNNSAYSKSFTVAAADDDKTHTSAANISATGSSVKVKYQLPNKVINEIPGGGTAETYFVARRISGGVFSLVGNEFTAKTQGSYSFRDGYIAKSKIDSALVDGEDWFDTNVKTTDRYTASITDTAVPVIEVQNRMPAYAPIDTKVELPSVIAYSENGNAEVKLVVTNAKGNEVKTDYNAEKNTYSFTGTTHGEYTLTYTATYANATPVTATYKINIGDVVGPEFVVTGGTTDRQSVGGKFTFGKITLADGESSSGVTVTKKLFDPSREEVTDATVSGSYSSYAEKENNGTDITFGKAGTYEVVYTATDSYGNVTTQRYTINVVSSGSGKPTTITTLSTVLIIVAVVLLAGVIIYVVRFRKVKEKK